MNLQIWSHDFDHAYLGAMQWTDFVILPVISSASGSLNALPSRSAEIANGMYNYKKNWSHDPDHAY